MQEKNERLIIRFGGEDSIGVETLQTCLDATVDTMKTLAEHMLGKKDYCKLIVEDVQKGSFILEILVAIRECLPLIIECGLTMAGAFMEILRVRKTLKGKPPKQIIDTDSGISIVNSDNVVVNMSKTVYNIYSANIDIERSLAKMNESLVKDDSREDMTVTVSDLNGETIDAINMSKEEIEQTSEPIDLAKYDSSIEEKVEEQWVKISQSVFIGDARWGFVTLLYGRKLSANVEDKEFLERFRNGQIILTPRTELLVELTYRMKRNCFGDATEVLSYSVTKVLEIKSPPKIEQMQIDAE